MIVKLNLLEVPTFVEVPEDARIARIKYVDGEHIEIEFYSEIEDAS